MTSVCGHLHLSSSYPEIYGCSHTTVIISSSGVISFPSPVKWSLEQHMLIQFFYSPSLVMRDRDDEDISGFLGVRKNPPLCDNSHDAASATAIFYEPLLLLSTPMRTDGIILFNFPSGTTAVPPSRIQTIRLI